MLKKNIEINRKTNLNSKETSIVVLIKKLEIRKSPNIVELELSAIPKVYNIIDTMCLFGLAQENRGEILGCSFDDNVEYRIVLKLKEELAEIICESYQNEEYFKLAITKDLENDISKTLRSIDSWQALRVTQDIKLPPEMAKKGSVVFGFQTKWAETPPAQEDVFDLGTVLESFLTSKDVEFNKYRNQDVWQITVNHPEESFLCNFHILAEQQIIMIVCHRPKSIPIDNIEIVNLYITQANYGLVNGNFAINMDTGELNFKTSSQITSIDAFEAILDFVLRQSIHSYSKYILGIDLLLNGELSPKEMIAIKEKE